jgi:hypothetical protein
VGVEEDEWRLFRMHKKKAVSGLKNVNDEKKLQ